MWSQHNNWKQGIHLRKHFLSGISSRTWGSEVLRSAALFFFFVNWNMYKGLWVFQGRKDLKYAFKLCQVKNVKQRLPPKDTSNWDGLRRSMLTWLPSYAALIRMKPSDWETAQAVRSQQLPADLRDGLCWGTDLWKSTKTLLHSGLHNS